MESLMMIDSDHYHIDGGGFSMKGMGQGLLNGG